MNFTIIGRIPGSDEDTCRFFANYPSIQKAALDFKKQLYRETGAKESDVIARYHESIYITHTIASRSPMEMSEPPILPYEFSFGGGEVVVVDEIENEEIRDAANARHAKCAVIIGQSKDQSNVVTVYKLSDDWADEAIVADCCNGNIVETKWRSETSAEEWESMLKNAGIELRAEHFRSDEHIHAEKAASTGGKKSFLFCSPSLPGSTSAASAGKAGRR